MRTSGWLVAARMVATRRKTGRNGAARSVPVARSTETRRSTGACLAPLLGLLVLALTVGAALALSPNVARGDQSGDPQESLGPTAAQTMELLESGKAEPLLDEPETDLHAAQTMPHRDLERGEALELAEAVFEPELESAAGIYGELEPERFLSNYAAVVPVSSLSEASEEGLAAEQPARPVLLESTLPLRTEGESGVEEPVSLGLERSEGELQSQNPLAEIGIPEQLGEGISLAGAEVEMTVEGAPEGRVATNASGEFAFYPETAEDTDLIVAPTPQGVETMTDIRSAEAPMQTTYDLSLPAGAELEATPSGGAEVVEAGRETVLITPPTAVDAAGNPVQAELSVSGDAVNVLIRPDLSTAYPILVDPNVITEGWRWTLNHDSLAAWSGNTSNGAAMQPVPYELWASQYPGLDLSSGIGGAAAVGTQANWEYWVPRYREDLAHFGTEPTSWVYLMSTEGVQFHEYGNNANYPALVIGITDPSKGWQVTGVHYGGQGEMSSWTESFPFENKTGQTNDKGADMNMVTYEYEAPSKRRDIYMADAYIAVVDETPPVVPWLKPPAHWVNTVAESIPFVFEDQGLGVWAAHMSYQGITFGSWGLNMGCAGTTTSPCPRFVRSSPGDPGEVQAGLAYNPESLPTGIDPVNVTVGDAMWGLGEAGHAATATVEIPVDHTGPEVTLSGPLTEQTSLGTRRASYALRIDAKDGTEAAPQSGVKKVEVLVDGSKVPMPEESEWEPSCHTENCHVSGEWTMSAAEYPAGTHEVKVIATDAVENKTTKVLQVELHPPAPTLTLSGTMTEQATLGTERPSYNLKVNGSASAESPTAAALPVYSSSFGTSGTGNGQFARPGGVALDSSGDLWVADSNNNRIEEFNEDGKFLMQIGPELATTECVLERPTAMAMTAGGNFWVTNSGKKKHVVEISPAGKCLNHFGGPGEGNGQFAGAGGPEAIAIDYHGNIWVADSEGGRLEKFDESGGFIRSVATKGKASGQLLQPEGIAIAPGGDVYVADWENDKVAEYGEGGAFIRQFGSAGSEPGQLTQPTGIAVDSKGDLWVADEKNDRVEEFNQAGEYLGKFGSEGSGSGQFKLSYPTGIATDARGDIWIADTADNRIERWVAGNFYNSTTAPSYARSIGTAGTTPGHQYLPTGVAVDAQGDLWTTDVGNDTLQRYSSKGEYEATFGGPGTEAGKFTTPLGLTINSGHVWVSDSGDNRIEEFSETGTYLGKFGAAGSGNGQFSYPSPPAVDSAHHIWVADAGNNRVQELTESGAWVRTTGTSGTGTLKNPQDVAVGPGNNIFVADYGDNRVVEFSETGTYIRQIGGAGAEGGQLVQPIAVYVDTEEHVWVVERGNNRVKEYSTEGAFLGQFGSTGSGPGQLAAPAYITGDGAGHVFVADMSNARISEWGQNYVSTTSPTYARSIGTAGTAAGQQRYPTDTAVDAKGDLWVTDIGNDTLQRYNSKGEYEATFGGPGKEAGKFEVPLGLTINSGHVWVSDSGNNRIEEFSETGAYITKFGEGGTANGKFSYPSPPAVDSNHHIWIADAGNNRVQELSEAGAWVRTIGTSGTGKLNDPQDVAVGPGNTIFVADYGNNRVVEFSETGTVLQVIGGAASETGQLSEPIAVYVDAEEHVWVVERGSSRVKEYSVEGAFLGQFGSAGSGPGQLSAPAYITGDGAGHLFVADMSNARISEWGKPSIHSQVSTEIAVDGIRRQGFETSCATKTCSVSGEWALSASSLGPGSHVVKVTTTDGLGNTTSKTLNIKVGDTTKPALSVGGELSEQPEGWVQQEEGSYGFHATATDAGYGVTSLVFRVDGKSVASKTQTCSAGACPATISGSLNAHEYAAGAHEAEFVATDGAGNVTTEKLTINVDPEGHISAAAAEATLEAVDATSGSNTVGPPNSEGEYPGMEPGLGFATRPGGGFEATGSNVPTTVGGDLEEGVELKVASEAALTISCPESSGEASVGEQEAYEPTEEPAEEEIPAEETPNVRETCVSLGTLEEIQAKEAEEIAMGLKQPGKQVITITPPTTAAGSVNGVNGDATATPNSLPDVDTVIRPIDDGGLTFEEIRGQEAPEHYAFEMELDAAQELRLINEHEAAVFYKRTGTRGFTISDQRAHDAVGCTVPTDFSVSGEILTFTVEYRGTCQESGQPFVYPIISGTGWEGGWTSSTELIGDKPEEPEPPAEGGANTGWYAHQLSNGDWVAGESGRPIVGAPTYEHPSAPKGAASASDAGQVRAFRVVTVPWCEKYYGEENIPVRPIPEPHWEGCLITPYVKVRGFVTALFHYETSPRHAVWWDFGREEDMYCNFDGVAEGWEAWVRACEFSGPNQQIGAGAHIVGRNFWRTIGHPPEMAVMGATWGACWPDYIDMYWNGNVSERDMIENHGVPEIAPEGRTCNWKELEQ